MSKLFFYIKLFFYMYVAVFAGAVIAPCIMGVCRYTTEFLQNATGVMIGLGVVIFAFEFCKGLFWFPSDEN